MKTEDIDLTKCINLRYKARIGDHHVIGRIGFDEDGYVTLLHNGIEPWRGNSVEEIMKIHRMEDFEIVLRDPGTYRDWQVGDKVCEDKHRNACYEVIFRSGELVVFKDWNNWASNPMTCSEAFTRFGMRLVLTDIEQQIIEEKKKYKPQDGDIVAWKDEEYCIKSAVSIYKEGNRGYATIFANGLTEYSTYATFAMDIIRPATDEEKQMLFDAMAKQGKRWNAEKKVVEDIPKPIPKPYEFRKGEPVLVRDYDDSFWKLAAFGKRSGDANYPYEVRNERGNCYCYRKCIPYNERTMHLLGTTEDYKEEQL